MIYGSGVVATIHLLIYSRSMHGLSYMPTAVCLLRVNRLQGYRSCSTVGCFAGNCSHALR